ncbi:Severe Depolymerization of Actin [Elasticomyces elasticus]|nr:Severe Depolymerization of Actin [Elasticomyces elasticus]
MGKRKVGALEKVDADLPNLQHKIRRDPLSYQDDFSNQWNQYRSLIDVYLQSPSTSDDASIVSLRELIDFVSHVADCYPRVASGFADDLKNLLASHHADLESELRDKVVGSLVLIRKKEIIDSATLLTTLFPLLLTTASKSLRVLLFQKILSELRTANSKSTNHRLNRQVQTLLYDLLASDPTSPKGIWAVKLTRELWKRQIWSDTKAVEIMKEAALSQNEKVVCGGVRFFLGGDKEREEAAEESSDDDDTVDMAKLKHQAGISKKTKKKAADLKKAAATVKRKERKKKAPHPLNFSALHLLNDPQGFAEKLFFQHLYPQHPKVRLNLEQKLLVLQLVSRLVGLHKLTLIQLYSYFLKFLTPRQPSVTSFLASLAQATHNLVPPDALEPLVQKVANEFVSEAAAAEVASAGLNAIREICVRQPLAMNETLLQDLVMYRKSKDKGTMMAAKGLVSLYREVGAELLKKRDRGKEAALGLRSGALKERRFGESEEGGIEGLDLLEKFKEEERQRKRGEKGLPEDDDDDEALRIAEEEQEEVEGWKNWDAEDDDSDDSGGWINVESDGEDINISDSDDEKPPPAKKLRTSPSPTPKNGEGNDEKKQPSATPDPTTTAQRVVAISKLATTRILTPADLAKLNELRTQASIQSHLPAARRKQLQVAAQAAASRHADDAITAETISGLAALSSKATREEKIAHARGLKPGEQREKHQSTTAMRKAKKEAEGKSTTNKEKARKKNFLMTLGKAKRKGKRSLVETRKVLRGHLERQKRGGKRGNKG